MCSWVSATRCDRILVPILLIVVLIFCAGARSVEGSSSLWIQASASNGPQVSRHVAGAVHDTIIVHGGFVTVFGFTSISSSLYLWKWGNQSWYEIPPSDGWPVGRQDHSGLSYGGNFYIFGGFSGVDYLNDLWRYNFETNTWTQLSSIGAPSARFGNSFSIDESTGNAYLFGGVNQMGVDLDDLFRYDIATDTWSALPSGPAPRVYHSGVFLEGCLYIFGGTILFTQVDLSTHFRYCVDTNEWIEIENSAGVDPRFRQGHHATRQSDRMVLFGGFNSIFPNFLGAFVEYDAQLNTWYTPLMSGGPPGVRRFHQVFLFNNTLIVVHGGQNRYVSLSDLWYTDYSRPRCPPGQYSPAGTTTCLICAPGNATTTDGRYECDICPPGTYTDGAGSPACNPCPIGTYNPLPGQGSASACIPCGLGYINPNISQVSIAACLPCPFGTYSNVTTSSQCYSCPPGTSSNVLAATSSSTCAPCNAGRFARNFGQATCDNCPPGFTSSVGAWNCSICPAGTYSNVGSPSCINCSPGYFSTSPGGAFISSCQACPSGTYQTSSGRTFCVQCPVGTAMNPLLLAQSSLASCAPCSLGYFQNATGQTSCDLCDQGTFQNTTGQTFCYLCPTGTYNPQFASTSIAACLACPAGSFGPQKGLKLLGDCQTCPAGTWGVNGLTECIKCIPGTFSQALGATSPSTCQRCFALYSSGEGAPACSRCPEGEFSNIGFSRCVECSETLESSSSTGWVLNGQFTYPEYQQNAVNAIERWILEAGSNPYFYATNIFESPPSSLGFTATSASNTLVVRQMIRMEENSPINFRLRVSANLVGVSAPPGSDVQVEVRMTILFNNATASTEYRLLFDENIAGWQTRSQDIRMSDGAIDWVLLQLIVANSIGTVYFDNVQMVPDATIACNCSIGHYYRVMRRGICHYCERGAACAASARYSCTKTGFYSWGGQSECSPCIPGWICADGFAFPCEPGQYHLNGSCFECPRNASCRDGRLEICGNGVEGDGGKYCHLCIPSTARNATVEESCRRCDNGTTSNHRRANCLRCPPGSFSVLGAACVACDLGSYQPISGAEQCYPCPVGFYADQRGTRLCTRCPEGTTTSSIGSISSASCIS